MAIENIKQMTRSLSSKGDEKKVAQYAPEDYLKRAVEQFIIEFPEFEELDREELYKEMDKKGWFSDQYASGPDPNDMSGWYEMYDDLKEKGELPDWMNSFEMFMENLDVLDISPMDFTKRKRKKEIQVASDPHPMEGYDDLLEKSALEVFGKKLKYLTDDEYEELEHRIREMDVDIPWAAKGGINGLRYGGDPRVEKQPEGLMQLAAHKSESGDDVMSSAILWFIDIYGQEGLQSIMAGETDMQSVINAYMDAKTEMN